MKTGDGFLSPLSESLKGVDYMKKLIALLLVLALCLGVLVACNDSEKMRAEIESEIRAEIEADERAKREKTYTFYSVMLECNPDVFKTNKLFTDYDIFYSAYRQLYDYNDEEIVKITRDTFENYYVLSVYAGNLLRSPFKISYNNLRHEVGNLYSIDFYLEYVPSLTVNSFEYAVYSQTGHHLVLIPRKEITTQDTPEILVHKVITVVN